MNKVKTITKIKTRPRRQPRRLKRRVGRIRRTRNINSNNLTNQQIDRILTKKMPRLTLQRPRRNRNQFTSVMNSAMGAYQLRMNALAKCHTYDSTYMQSLMFPEFTIEGKVPKNPTTTISYHVRVPYTVNTNASGNLVFLWNPQFVVENNITNGGFLINNAAAVNGSVIETTVGFVPQPMAVAMNIPPGMFTSYRLVSAGMRVFSTLSLTNAAGKVAIAAATDLFPNQSLIAGTGLLAVLSKYSVFSAADQALKVSTALFSHEEYARAIWTPVEDTDVEEFIDLNNTKATNENSAAATSLIYGYVTGAGASQPVSFELYYNIEFPTQPNSFMSGLGHTPSERTDPMEVAYVVNKDTQNVVQHGKLEDEILHKSYTMIGNTGVISTNQYGQPINNWGLTNQDGTVLQPKSRGNTWGNPNLLEF